MRNVLCIVMIVSLLYFFPYTAEAAELKAGTAITNITAPIGYPMAGYAARKENSKGIHDSLYARVLLLKTDSLALAIVTCDLAGFYSERSYAKQKNGGGLIT